MPRKYDVFEADNICIKQLVYAWQYPELGKGKSGKAYMY